MHSISFLSPKKTIFSAVGLRHNFRLQKALHYSTHRNALDFMVYLLLLLQHSHYRSVCYKFFNRIEMVMIVISFLTFKFKRNRFSSVLHKREDYIYIRAVVIIIIFHAFSFVFFLFFIIIIITLFTFTLSARF